LLKKTNYIYQNLYGFTILLTIFLASYVNTGYSSDRECSGNPLKNFSSLSSAERKNTADKLFGQLTISDTSEFKRTLGRLICLSVTYGEKSIYVGAMNRYAEFLPAKEALHFVSASYRAAYDMKDYRLMGESEKYKSYLYKRMDKYDSAVVCLMHAIDIFESMNDTKNLAEAYHTLGDMYYDVELFEKAAFCFKKVMALKGSIDAWNTWRQYVIANDLGLIAIELGNYDKALEYFFSSLNNKKNIFGNSQIADSTRLVYLYRKISETYFLKKDYKNTVKYSDLCLKSLPVSNSALSDAQAYMLRGGIFLETGDILNSLKYLKKAEEMNRKAGSIDLEYTLCKYLAKAYKASGDLQKSVYAENRYYHLRDSLEHSVKKAAFVEIIAGHNYEKYKTGISILRKEREFLIIIILVISAFTALLTKLFFSLREKNKYLKEKNIALAFSPNRRAKQATEQYLPGNADPPEDSKGNEIIEKLEKLIYEEKIYYNSELNLNDLAEKLGTNRGYLSKVINSKYNKNFNAYINEFRINEAIKIMTNNELPQYSLEGVASSVGFNTRASFINAFKKQTGLTPSAFIDKTK
jgi:AraC-like DNA-binding protein